MWVGVIDSVNVVIIVKHNPMSLHPQESWHGKEQKSSYVLKAMTFVFSKISLNILSGAKSIC